jgi:hypothetical protein
MKNRLRLSAALSALTLILSACAGEPGQWAAAAAETEEAAKAESVYQITDYKTKALNEAIPEWVDRYLEEGAAGVEALEIFQDRYVFIARNGGTNVRVLEQWNAGFAVELDFARLAAVRIEKRFTQEASGFPDTAYGSYFEALVRAASDADWTGAVREDDFWLKQLYSEAGENGDGLESYNFMILVTIDKTQLASQIQNLLSRVSPRSPPSGDQIAAINRVRERFFDNF